VPHAGLIKPPPALVAVGSALACLGTIHQFLNLRLLRDHPLTHPR